jgi:hypothetical protein
VNIAQQIGQILFAVEGWACEAYQYVAAREDRNLKASVIIRPISAKNGYGWVGLAV